MFDGPAPGAASQRKVKRQVLEFYSTKDHTVFSLHQLDRIAATL